MQFGRVISKSYIAILQFTESVLD